MRRALPAVMALLGAPSCLDPNPDFEGDGTTSIGDDGGSLADDAGSLDDGSTSTGGCVMPPPDTDPDQEEPLMPGSHMYVLEEPSSVHAFNVYYMDAGPGELHLAADVALDLCAYVDCTGEPDTPDCVEPAISHAQDDSGLAGCCSVEVLDMSFDCLSQMSGKVHVRISGADAACTRYELEVDDAIP